MNAVSDDQSYSDEVPPSYADSPNESGFEGLPELFASFDPHEWNLDELLKRFRESRSCERSRERRSNVPSPESVVEEKFHEDIGTVNKE